MNRPAGPFSLVVGRSQAIRAWAARAFPSGCAVACPARRRWWPCRFRDCGQASADGADRQPRLAGGGAVRGGPPGMAVGHFDAQRDHAVGAALGFQRRIEPVAPVPAHQPAAAAFGGIAAQRAHVLQQFFRAAVGECQDFLIHHRIGEAVFHQQVAEVVHVHEGRRGGAQAGIGQRLAQLAQRGRSQTGEHGQPADLQHAPPFGQRRVRRAVPVQGQVGPDQLQRFRRQAGLRQVAIDEGGRGRATARQLADPGAQPARRVALARGGQQRLAVVQAGVGRVRIALTQQRQVVARATARVQHGLRRQPDVLQPAQHAAGDFAIEELGLGQVATARELARHVGADDGQGGQGADSGRDISVAPASEGAGGT